MDTNTLENIQEPDDKEATYRALRDSILQVFHLGTKIAKESNPDNELQVSWDLGDTSLMNWISDTHCYLSRKAQKLQFLARPSKLEIISFTLQEDDKLLICSDTLRQQLSDGEIDDVLQKSSSPENAIQNLLSIVNATNSQLRYNIVVMEVIDSKKLETPVVITTPEKPQAKKESPTKLILTVLLLALALAGLIYWLTNPNYRLTQKPNSIDTNTIPNYIQSDSAEIAKANEQLAKELTTDTLPLNNGATETPAPATNAFTSPTKTDENTSSNATTHSSTSGGSSHKKLTPEQAQLQYQLLEQQKDKWTAIRDSLKEEVNNGSKEAIEKLKNSERVLKRIEQKMKINANIME
ncbi:hypothetical protein [Flectobacillus major]|uniref:hypothetical protein n=1 Tax=Flectobacillus major TaxID=103 RepID=UPI00040A8C01|nr:hypothetical protein [Flectobacillus major]